MTIQFEWDAGKAARNRRRHGVDFAEATTIFSDPLSLTIEDAEHSFPGEDRFVTVGESHLGRIIVVAHTDRGDAVRIISARLATRREREQYELDG